MRLTIVIIILLTSIFPSVFAFAETLPVSKFDGLKKTTTTKITNIIDPLTLYTADERLIRLSGINIPDLDIHTQGEISVLTMDILKDLLGEKDIALYQTPKEDWGRTTRMGHHLAHVARKSDDVWVQGTLLRLGLARVETNERTPELAADMLKLEELARAEKLGLWADEQYSIKTPENAAAFMDSFQIIEGQVHSVSLRKNRLYINFGPDWKTDLTVAIAPENKRAFTKNGLDPQSWNGTTIRARGWLREYNGPYMEITHPQALEFPQ